MSSVTGVDGSGSGVTTTATQNEADAGDRFLKLLVAQMQNQDPMNPLDNAQVTSQMAQINTVTGIEKLNKTVAGLDSQLVQMQALQGASLVGQQVTVAGNQLAIEDGVGSGGFELTGAADAVKVEILNGAGRVVDTLSLGAMSSGRHDFEWQAGSAGDGDGYRFKVSATAGKTSVLGDSLAHDQVEAVNVSGGQLQLELKRGGTVAYDAVRSYN